MSWNEYIDEYGDEAGYESFENWEVRINDEKIDTLENKADAISVLFDSIDSISDYKLISTLKSLEYEYDDLVHNLMESSSMDFYEIIDEITDELNIDDNFKLINLDNDEPEFAEL